MWPNGDEPAPRRPGAGAEGKLTEDRTLVIRTRGDGGGDEWIESDEYTLLSLEA